MDIEQRAGAKLRFSDRAIPVKSGLADTAAVTPI